MAWAGTLAALSVYEGQPQYLFLARKSPYARLSGRFPLYSQLEEMAGDENNNVILTP